MLTGEQMGFIWSERGQSVVIGSILMFAILISFLGLLQTFLIPTQIAEAEQTHANQIDTEFEQIYTSITNAASDNAVRSSSITLGTDYTVPPPFITPPPASGTIRSESIDDPADPDDDLRGDGEDAFDSNEIEDGVIEDTCGLNDINVKSLNYNIRYNQYANAGQHTRETGLKYKNIDGAILDGQQRLISTDDDGSVTRVNLVPITAGSISESSTSARSVTFVPGATGTTRAFSLDSGDTVEITIPIQGEQAWNDIFSSSFQNDAGIDITTSGDEATVTLNDDSRTYFINCTPVGINKEPNNDPDPPDVSNPDSDPSGVINPIGDAALVLFDVTDGGGQSVDWEFVNEDDDETKTVKRVRIPWLLDPGNSPETLELTYDGQTAEVEVLEAAWTTNDKNGNELDWEWSTNNAPQNGAITVTKQNGNTPNDGYAVVFYFEDDTTSTYFVPAA